MFVFDMGIEGGVTQIRFPTAADVVSIVRLGSGPSLSFVLLVGGVGEILVLLHCIMILEYMPDSSLNKQNMCPAYIEGK